MSDGAQMVCGTCGFPDNGQTLHCLECGKKLRDCCPKCGAIVHGRPKHCGNCGAPLLTLWTDRPRIQTPEHLSKQIVPKRGHGGRIIATILRADIVNSTGITGRLEPEDAKRILFPVLKIMADAVHRYEGIVVRDEGDAIVASFGAPLAVEDHAQRACYAALDMQAAIHSHSVKMAPDLGAPLAARIGIDSGLVVYTTQEDAGKEVLDRIDGTPLSIVARIEPFAAPGNILLSESALSKAEGYMQVRAMGTRNLKGLGPVQVYELAGVVTRMRIHACAARGLSRFVGRQHETELLRRAAREARSGHGQGFALVGEAGVGKSRVFQEFIHSSEVRDWLVLEAGSVSYAQTNSYFPLIDLLTRYFDIHGRDDQHRAREKIVNKLAAFEEEGLLAHTPYFLGALGMAGTNDVWLNLTPVERQGKMFHAIKQLLIRESQVQPLCLVFEDLHWIDAETLAFLEMLQESIHAAKVLLLVNYRPDYHGRPEPQSKWVTKITQVPVNPLPPESAGEMLAGLIGSQAQLAPIKQALMDATKNNPLFLEESVRCLIESGVLVGGPGQWRPKGSLPAGFVPESIQALLAARIDRLRPETKEILQCAAVIGTEVPRALLEAVAGLAQSEFELGLRELQSAEFLYEKTLFPEIIYTFKHVMTREVAYASLLRERRMALHARAAYAIVAQSEGRVGERVEAIAWHAELGELWPMALDYLERAGTKAFALYANAEAVGFLDKAIKNVLPHLPESRATLEQAVDLRFKLRNALIPMCELVRVSDTLDEVEKRLGKLRDKPRSARLAAFRCNHHFLAGEQRRAIEIGEAGLLLARECGDPIVEGELLYRIGQSHHALGENRPAIALIEQSLEFTAGQREANRFELSIILEVVNRTWLSFVLAETGEFRTGIEHAKRALGIAEKAEHRLSEVLGWLAIGHLLRRKGELDGAIAALQRGEDLCDKYSLPMWRLRVLSSLGVALACCGEVDEGLKRAEEAKAGAEKERLIVDQPMFLVQLGEASLLANQTAKALQCGNEALDIALAHEGKGNQAWARFLIARASWADASDAIDGPIAELEAALTLAFECGAQPLAAFCQTLLSDIHCRRGDAVKATDYAAAAEAIYAGLDMRRLPLAPVR
jgi:class 3 adenylate cyclase/tetratricopeptide (TPR) repeat protein